jgi:hypothetical protein
MGASGGSKTDVGSQKSEVRKDGGARTGMAAILPLMRAAVAEDHADFRAALRLL